MSTSEQGVAILQIKMFLHKGAGQQVHEEGLWSVTMKFATPHPLTGWQAPPRRMSLKSDSGTLQT